MLEMHIAQCQVMSGLPPTDRTPIVSIYFSITMVGLRLELFLLLKTAKNDVNYNNDQLKVSDIEIIKGK